MGEIHYSLGCALQDQGKLDQAMASLQTALSLKPHYPEALNNLGNAFLDQGDLQAATASFKPKSGSWAYVHAPAS
ncbi:MAG: tetratricopeptide repeat protein [Magnetococcales bacterium]|nr:tetratricopeptide repeat protein [Magnetococcales bacterium]